jgi:two-component system, OmpR family, response regulator
MKRILIVEDDKLLGKAIADTLAEADYEVVWAENGADALTAISQKPVDMVYLDIMLPGEDGYSILQKIKADANHADTPVVMLTNLGQMSEINKAMEMGANDYIVKANVDLEKLVELTRTKYLVGF